MVPPVWSLMYPWTTYGTSKHHMIMLRLTSLKISGLYTLPRIYWSSCLNPPQLSSSSSCTIVVRNEIVVSISFLDHSVVKKVGPQCDGTFPLNPFWAASACPQDVPIIGAPPPGLMMYPWFNLWSLQEPSSVSWSSPHWPPRVKTFEVHFQVIVILISQDLHVLAIEYLHTLYYIFHISFFPHVISLDNSSARWN